MYYGHPKFLTLEQGEFVLERKLKDLDFVVSPSQPETPRDGSCLFHALLDQYCYIPDLRDVASNHQELRFRIINYGYDFYLKTEKVNWANLRLLCSGRRGCLVVVSGVMRFVSTLPAMS